MIQIREEYVMKKFGLIAVLLFATAGVVKADVLWRDDFNSYSNDVRLKDTGPWSVTSDVMSISNGRVKYYNNAYGGKAQYAYADKVQSHHIDGVAQSNYVVKVTSYDFSSSYMATQRMVYARVAGDEYVYGVVKYSSNAWYLSIEDSNGSILSDTWAGTYDSALPVNMELTVNGSNVSWTVTHNNTTKTVTGTTTVDNTGAPGFGSWNPGGYAIMYYDNFEVSSVPEPATLSLLAVAGMRMLRRAK